MSQGIQVEVWGPYALFSRPELKVERVSYDVMTPSAARGLIKAIYWHPGMEWYIDRIHVLNPIAFTNIRRNEVKHKILASNVRSVMSGADKPLALYTGESILQRASMVLTDVRYVIDAHFTMTDQTTPSDNEGKFIDIARRRLARGQCYHQPCFGCREFPAGFRAWSGGPIPTVDETRSLGLMLYGMDYSDPCDIQPMFFHAALTHGVLEVAGQEVLR
ncbi:type I-C CRISPR-associated protein Cas5c [Butyricicoccus faecihominis]|uniref:type I-C CRISPR-associated protein Cas5c n=1 Tax=Butyricicoccus faecihominis TaxID=1712515 RepID=UPI002479BA42|nr:type I-C CRISPR-associated protein Cas5c [Butyricicoccus faecihominis]MCQ5128659.1 type I-C CRISPR-associated protein Cas5c [Butyricicoccus faecihominis]